MGSATEDNATFFSWLSSDDDVDDDNDEDDSNYDDVKDGDNDDMNINVWMMIMMMKAMCNENAFKDVNHDDYAGDCKIHDCHHSLFICCFFPQEWHFPC